MRVRKLHIRVKISIVFTYILNGEQLMFADAGARSPFNRQFD